jgi:ferrous iron transport protein A
MKLADIEIGQSVTIEEIGGERTFRRRLLELGLVPGTSIRLMGVAPLGDPLELLVRGASLSIRRNEASAVVVRTEFGRSLAPAARALANEMDPTSVGVAGPS